MPAHATRCTFNPDSERLDLGDGLFFNSETVVQTRQWDHDIDIYIGVDQGRLVAERLDIRRNESGKPVTTETLRSLPLASLVRYGAGGVHYGEWGSAWPTEEEGQCVARHGLDDETLRIVARVYRVAFLLGDPPTKR